jgi:hypothetical protein
MKRSQLSKYQARSADVNTGTITAPVERAG